MTADELLKADNRLKKKVYVDVEKYSFRGEEMVSIIRGKAIVQTDPEIKICR